MIIAIINNKLGVLLFRIKARIISGANFCQVAKIIQDNQDIDVITDGNQKWSGAIPSFSKMAERRMIFI